MAALVEARWRGGTTEEVGEFAGFAAEVFCLLDWLPARLTAVSFAIVGDFEDAVYCWRNQAAGWLDRELGIVLSSGAGALGVRLGETLHAGGSVRFRPELGLGDEADVEHLQSALGLAWRGLVLWVLVIGLITLAHWVG
jgi:cobalamin biosynthesis protein CobD/CbiB